MLEATSKKMKSVNKNDDKKTLNIEVFDKNNQLIDGATIISRDLVCIKCYVRY
jgi:DNA integrity scanning protein DisA with diadenylate cyclase activity